MLAPLIDSIAQIVISSAIGSALRQVSPCKTPWSSESAVTTATPRVTKMVELPPHGLPEKLQVNDAPWVTVL